ncbi:hypothetical protein Thimo_0998 [Thioflavicoccus mobilis 8321]|uniref:O-antigen polysaccharide polymerase Wzy n=2 Tax=Thioflavicoccus mobilis TaxID=80679 RepID=L0GWS4_9GAMM|nr:hypothetical protein Thimo_0998 [Thioflavicoccus mobilis 8321]
MIAVAHWYALEIRRSVQRMLLVAYLLWMVMLMGWSLDSTGASQSAAFIVPISLGVASAWIGFSLVRRFPPLLLTPIPLMFAFIATFFGVGPCFHLTVEGSLPMSDLRVPVTVADFFRVQALNLAGLSFLFLGMWWSQVLIKWHFSSRNHQLRVSGRPLRRREVLDLFRVSAYGDKVLRQGWLLFLCLAILLRGSDRILGHDLGSALPGFLNMLDRSAWIAALLGGILAGRKGRIWWLAVLLPVVIGIADGALYLRKSFIVWPVILGFLGLYLGGKGARTLSVGAIVVVALFLVAKPIVDAGRSAVWATQSMSAAQYYGQLAQKGDALGQPDGGVNEAWARLNYTPVQTGLMAAYDNGTPGGTFAEMHWMFIPRFLAMGEKPILDFGARTTMVLFGHDRSSTGPTIFGEAYWNGGWLLVAISGLVTGAIFVAIGLTSLWLLLQKDVLAWPLVFSGLGSGQLLTGMFTKGLVGAAVVYFALVAVFWFFKRRRRRRAAHFSADAKKVGQRL